MNQIELDPVNLIRIVQSPEFDFFVSFGSLW